MPCPLATSGGTHIVSPGTIRLLQEIGGGKKILEMTARFYDKVFQDQHIDQFVTSHNDPHSERLGLWIVEKMGGEGTPHSSSRPPNPRSTAHSAAWNSPKRKPGYEGRRFKLDDCRVWMRLMFWAARDAGLDRHPDFLPWYTQFIAHFMGVYEYTAPPYAPESAAWSLDPNNIKRYLDDGRMMRDVVGKTR
eukprot:NODE_1102_length_1105_cov_7.660038_g843_i0.p1 GENE.NODE_1102_length_1105_cov_7.660038_g843_i0~~NODE_1102_length_1105_cov_7.660038_g843_i0.p1  ORF type:complete len:191 (+),score=35.73 NODE_1102_length_1105_cov_7.660038_g843_i0:58-630(+)